MPGRLEQLVGQVDDRLRHVVVGVGDRGVDVELLAPGVLLTGGVAESLGHVPDRRLRPVADHVGHLGGVAPAVTLVDLLDHLLATVGVEVDVDVRLLLPGRGQEPLEGQVEHDRVHRGDLEHVADHRVGRRAPALAEDAPVPGVVDHVVHDQEVAREVLLLDDLELFLQPLLGLLPDVRVALVGAPAAELAQPADRGVAERDALLGQPRLGQLQVEGALVGDLDGLRDRAGIAGEQLRHLRPGAQVGAGTGQPAVHLGQAAAGPDRGHRRAQPPVLRPGVVHVVAGHQRQAMIIGQSGEGVVDGRVGGQALVDQLDHHAVGAEEVGQPVQLVRGGRRSGRGQRLPDRALAAAGHDHPVALGRGGELARGRRAAGPSRRRAAGPR